MCALACRYDCEPPNLAAHAMPGLPTGVARPGQGRLYRSMLPDRAAAAAVGFVDGDDDAEAEFGFGFGDLLDSEAVECLARPTQDPILKLGAAVSRYGGTSALVKLYSKVSR